MAVMINGVLVDVTAETIRDERGETLSLRPQSFAILRILLENPERVVSKQELMQTVWPDVAVTNDSLVQCIHEIRKLLRDDGHSIIKTVQRRGYRFQNTVLPVEQRTWRSPFALTGMLAASFLLLMSVGLWLTGHSPKTGAPPAVREAAGSQWDSRRNAVDIEELASSTSNMAHREYYLGTYYYHRPSPENLAKAKKYFERAIELESNFSAAHAALAKTYVRVSTLAYSRALGINLDEAALKARQALEGAGIPNADTHIVRSWLALRKFQNREAIVEAEMALKISPGDTDALEALARARIFGGQPIRGLELASEIMRQNPTIADRSLFLMGLAEFALGNYSASVQYIESGMTLGSDDIFYAGILAAAHGLLGNSEKSRNAFRIFVKGFGNRPDLARAMINFPFADARTAQFFAAGLEAAGAKVWFSRDDGGYLTLTMANRMAGSEIVQLLTDSRIEGGGFWCSKSWRRSETEYGLTEYDGTPIHTGVPSGAVSISSVKGDLLCENWSTEQKNMQLCSSIFRVSDGNARKRWGDYVLVTDTGPHPFIVIR